MASRLKYAQIELTRDCFNFTKCLPLSFVICSIKSHHHHTSYHFLLSSAKCFYDIHVGRIYRYHQFILCNSGRVQPDPGSAERSFSNPCYGGWWHVSFDVGLRWGIFPGLVWITGLKPWIYLCTLQRPSRGPSITVGSTRSDFPTAECPQKGKVNIFIARQNNDVSLIAYSFG